LKKSFKVKELANDDCFQNRVTGIRNYVKGEDLPKATLAAIERIIKKIEPRYPKKPEGPPPPNPNGKHPRSPSERSFASIVGYGRSVITLITKLGVNYNPPDANLSVASMTTLVDAIEGLNKDVQNALDDYGTANRARKDLYTNIKTGLESRKKAILSYLASFPGLKKSNHYIEFNDALKGI
jgi:hypothetical protein